MDLTIKEIADTLDVTKNTVKYHMKKLNDALEEGDYLYKNNGMIYVREAGIDLIKESVLAIRTENAVEVVDDEEPAKETDKTTTSQAEDALEKLEFAPLELDEDLPQELKLLLKERDERLKLLEKELERLSLDKKESSAQLVIKDEQIAELHKLLNQQQQLNLVAETKIKELEENKKLLLEGSTTLPKKWWQFWK